jgi:ADP-ribosylglycohydrolase
MRLVPLAIWASRLKLDQLYLAVRLYCGITHLHEFVVESCYLYCYAMKMLLVNGHSGSDAYFKTLEESNRIARVHGVSTLMYWIENNIEISSKSDINEMPIPHYRPINHV